MRLSRLGRAGLVTLGIAAAVGAGVWAGSQAAVTSAPVATAGPTSVTVEVVEGSIGRAVTFNVTVDQPFSLVATNVQAGVVTRVGSPGAEIGGELFAVAGVSVRAMPGSEPFWRDLMPGETGPDVAELQEGLISLGYLDGPADGSFGPATSRAVRAWQKGNGESPTGVVPLGAVIAVPGLPTTVKLGDEIQVGALLAGGEKAVFARHGEPTFSLVVSSAQAAQVPVDATVTVSLHDHSWTGVVGERASDANGNTVIAVTAPGGGVLCGSDCAALPSEERLSLMASVQVVPDVSGSAVPVAAVTTDASGAASVRLPDGSTAAVTVLASGDGTAIVAGIDVGTQVVIAGSGSS
ncbi:peptidoglycan-binding protein [Isoptericola sp. b490]|uniref:peptidoglycan-binding domain-containing protein n=1 Tax=Actinotalea lenta TaxID=3064654 RepID=UPI0027133378|nr:peptidoglycan-binding protein [Isoptericola sp. b490]MDO8122565.1 peptidoglycan-binding protein [Isoptericola sp. b490]